MIVGIAGKARSGKGELASIAVKEFGATVVSFAAGVKEEVGEWLTMKDVCWEHRHLYGDTADKEATLRVAHSYVIGRDYASFFKMYAQLQDGYWYFTPRSLMQWYGTEYRRAQDPDYWVKRAMSKCTGYRLYVIDDVRFPNEARAIAFTGGKLIRVERSSCPVPSNPNHPSEIALDNYEHWHYLIHNGSSLFDYHDKARKVLREITGVH